MGSTQEIRRRIKSVKSTKQITKAMEMVAASKMRRAQESCIQTRPYSHQALLLLKNIADKSVEKIHPLLFEREVKKTLAIVITSDKGLCGGYNSQVLKSALSFLSENSHKKIELITIGKQGEQFLRKLPNKIIATYTEFPTYPTSLDVAPIAKMAIEGFATEIYDEVILVYTNFESTLRQIPQVKTLLPMSLLKAKELLEETVKNEPVNYEYIYEPEPEKVLEYVLPRLTEMQIFHAILDAIASEQSARMMAMKSASDNATELIDDLTLTYNSLRQASITQEIAEVSTGAEVLNK
jgi:F-type H+-transporting ATPase subunit gamma